MRNPCLITHASARAPGAQKWDCMEVDGEVEGEGQGVLKLIRTDSRNMQRVMCKTKKKEGKSAEENQFKIRKIG